MPGWRDEATVALLERDGWRSPRDYLAECVWCGLPFWRHAGSGLPRLYCSVECQRRKAHRFRVARVGREYLRRVNLERYWRRKANRRTA